MDMKKVNGNRWIALGTLAAMSATMVGGPLIEQADAASAKRRRNIAIGAAALGAYGLLRGNRTLAILGGATAAYAYKRYHDARKAGRYVSVNEAFRGRPVYDSRGNRYSGSSRYNPNRTYYTARGRARQ
jgi:hypothetical protein